MAVNVDLARLSPDERDQYALIGTNQKGQAYQRWRLPGTWSTLAIWVVLVIGLFVALVVTGSNSDGTVGTRGNPAAGILLTSMVVVMFGGIVLIILIARSEARQLLDEERLAYLHQIGYAQRTRPWESPSSHSGYESTRRWSQHRWYEGHSELDYRDRETAEMFGMDADTYVSNFLENDKD